MASEGERKADRPCTEATWDVLSCTALGDMRRPGGQTHGASEAETGRMLSGCEFVRDGISTCVHWLPRRPMPAVVLESLPASWPVARSPDMLSLGSGSGLESESSRCIAVPR